MTTIQIQKYLVGHLIAYMQLNLNTTMPQAYMVGKISLELQYLVELQYLAELQCLDDKFNIQHIFTSCVHLLQADVSINV